MNAKMRDSITAAVTAEKEEQALESIVSVLGDQRAQEAVQRHSLAHLLAKEQGHGLDYLYGYRRAA